MQRPCAEEKMELWRVYKARKTMSRIIWVDRLPGFGGFYSNNLCTVIPDYSDSPYSNIIFK